MLYIFYAVYGMEQGGKTSVHLVRANMVPAPSDKHFWMFMQG